jgi:hypothetical protein
MRQMQEAVLSFASDDKGLPKVVCDYRARYPTISQVLDRIQNFRIAVHQDIKPLSQGGRKGRKGDFTSGAKREWYISGGNRRRIGSALVTALAHERH